ncbi:hypothetical protein E3N88_43975 [Mikania micrantha]|uniref:Uncharacterized protein n=1 Tax=Mikania micrantha TaxID=192012 RepID=A0A5N6LDE5_9ASTR|nr:hypothetical protein E3N88_43975 [Mikania micrantha]
MLGAGLQFGRSRGGEDRFYNPAKARRNRQNQDNPRRVQNDPSELIPVELPVCNLKRFLESITPSVPAQYPSKVGSGPFFGCLKPVQTCLKKFQNLTGTFSEPFTSARQSGLKPSTCVSWLPRCKAEWSAYGTGVPLILNDNDKVVQYYVPYLSGVQLYMDPMKSSAGSRQHTEDSDVDSFRDSSSDASSDFDLPKGEITQRFDQLSLNYKHALGEGFSSDEGEPARPRSCLSFEYFERNQPWGREPLTDKILDLACCFPELKSMKSCDLLSSSWLSVAWYPIYRIPMGPTLKDLDACFLTFHSLHTPSTGNHSERPPEVMHPEEIGSPKISLPVFGLASYKLKAPLWTNNESMLLTHLLQAAESWLANLQVNHPDFLFFSRR